MSDLEKAIATDIRVAIYRVSTKHGIEQTDLFVDAVAKIASDAVLDVVTAHMAVTDEDALQILRGYWRNAGASFCDAEIKHVVELLEAFVASKLKAEPK